MSSSNIDKLSKKVIGDCAIKVLGFTHPDLELVIQKFIVESSNDVSKLVDLLVSRLECSGEDALNLSNELRLASLHNVLVADVISNGNVKEKQLTHHECSSLDISGNLSNVASASVSLDLKRDQSSDSELEYERELARVKYLKEREQSVTSLTGKILSDRSELYRELNLHHDSLYLKKLREDEESLLKVKELITNRQETSKLKKHFKISLSADDKVDSKIEDLKKVVGIDDKPSCEDPGDGKLNRLICPVNLAFKDCELLNGCDDFSLSSEPLSRQRKFSGKDPQLASSRVIESQRSNLPIYKYRNRLLKAIKDNKVIIMVGHTGCGKTTQLPQYLLEEGYSYFDNVNNFTKMIAVTQPRRVAATSVASRVAYERRCQLGHEVGYSVRFDYCANPSTKLLYLTDGTLLKQMIHDPTLSRYSVIMIDEAHERTMKCDLLLALLRDLVEYRTDNLRLIIASATLNASKFSSYFMGAPILTVPSRMYPVKCFYTESPVSNYVDACAQTVMTIVKSKKPGDILIFLPGVSEIALCESRIYDLCRQLLDEKDAKRVVVMKFYAALSLQEQRNVFIQLPEGKRKVVLATNIAETSVTIDGIVFVIDPGFVRETRFDYSMYCDILETNICSRSACMQRAGRAGRTEPGECYRLFTKKSWEDEFSDSSTPEILRSNLTELILTLKYLGIDDFANFDWLDRPSSAAFESALNFCYFLGAFTADGDLSLHGEQIIELPCNPNCAALLIYAEKVDVLSDAAILVGMLEESNNIMLIKHGDLKKNNSKQKVYAENDFFQLLAIFKQWESSGYLDEWADTMRLDSRALLRAKNVSIQLTSLLTRYSKCLDKSHVDDNVSLNLTSREELLKEAIVAGFFSNIAQRSNGDAYCLLRNELNVFIHPSSILKRRSKPKDSLLSFNLPTLIVFSEIVATNRCYLKNVMQLDLLVLKKVLPSYFETIKHMLV